MKPLFKTLLSTSLTLCAFYSLADDVGLGQNCNSTKIKPSHHASALFDKGDGTILDIVNNVLWSKCSVGQEYVNGECIGEPTNFATWESALTAISVIGDNHRLPNIIELASLVERSCFDPAIDLSAFPNTPSAVYWTNTPDFKVNSHLNIEARIVDFKDGGEFVLDVTDKIFVRTVIDF